MVHNDPEIPINVKSLRDPGIEKFQAEETARLKALEEKRKFEAEERRIEREIFRRCDHDFEDVTEERHRLVEMRGGLPNWIKYLIGKKDPRAMRMNSEAYKSSRYEKCGGCGLLKVSNVVVAP